MSMSIESVDMLFCNYCGKLIPHYIAIDIGLWYIYLSTENFPNIYK